MSRGLSGVVWSSFPGSRSAVAVAREVQWLPETARGRVFCPLSSALSPAVPLRWLAGLALALALAAQLISATALFHTTSHRTRKVSFNP